MSILGTPTKIINGNPVEDPEPDFDWDTFAAHNPDFSHEIDESFTDGGTGGDLMSAMSRVADYLRRKKYNEALMLSARWATLIEQAREKGMERYAGTFPRPAA